ncbi:N-terminal C2 in EEIG1 and EHBP1 proteins-domain-containing protein [Boeremia exigua]|uniref:N-terminal C2 in EEIG1 and EHBP1 proteins-domain-containing protein n=1 Tax=Boeremia exigua TaxID=749465 RepID=UPI001E8E6D11|nr:N-terminal C2 in EEIG1 and EHBP1 proteins-domain-containing protein [Boeremia exigua]KAH6633561.1 N-terminal C2 in EEIG1 and EHBP1 proteins-domain-containing protein [Boeremia exigua]
MSTRRLRTVAFAAHTLTIPVPKNRRPKFDLHLRIVDLNNVPLTSGTSFVKWHLPLSTAAEHRGRTDHCPISEHKVQYNYDATLPVRLTVDKNGMLQESFIDFEVVQEYASSGRGERITLGSVKLNLAEYVEQSELTAALGEDPGVTRRYLMQDSKINSTLKLGIYMRQTEGDKNFIAPALKTAQGFSGIAGIMAGEQAELEESGAAPSLTSKSRDASELQDMYRRTLAAYWSAQPGELKADECIEDIFAGGDGWGDRAKPYSPQRGAIRFTTVATGDSSASVSGDERLGDRRMMRKSQDTLRAGSAYSGSPKKHVRGRGSLEQQAHHMKAEAERKRHRPHHEVDEFELRHDLCSWKRPI